MLRVAQECVEDLHTRKIRLGYVEGFFLAKHGENSECHWKNKWTIRNCKEFLC